MLAESRVCQFSYEDAGRGEPRCVTAICFLVLTTNVSSLLQHRGRRSTRLLRSHIESELFRWVRSAEYVSGDFTKRVGQHIL